MKAFQLLMEQAGTPYSWYRIECSSICARSLAVRLNLMTTELSSSFVYNRYHEIPVSGSAMNIIATASIKCT